MSEVEALRAALESRDAQLTRQNAGLVQMARERDAAIAERDALRTELVKTAASAANHSSQANALLSEVDCMEHEDSQLRVENDALRAELAQEAALRAELTAEVKRLKVFEAAELQRRAILEAMNGGG